MPRQAKLDDPLPLPGGTTEPRSERIISYLRQGAYLETAAQASGINVATLYRWLNDPRPRFREFREAVQRARAEAEVNLLLRIQAAARGGGSRKRQQVVVVDGKPQVMTVTEESEADWRAAAWVLERTAPTRFGRREALAVTLGDGQPVGVADAEAAGIARRLDKFMAERGVVPREIEPPPPSPAEGDEDVVDAEIIDEGSGS